ncbi:MAG: PIN domain-containing protein [Aeromicrobium sp.]|uniref:PIN domain-containing protein n=1 Tax=Aeromicrobium sp. TaxID=1871063 RepID=UPI0039E6DCD4
MTISVTLADANILISRTLRDYFVYAASVGAIQIHWSDSILDETARNLIAKYGFSTQDAAVLVALLGQFLPHALVETAERDLATAEKVAMSPNDRHVLAAALSAQADLLLTDNIRHFPRGWMAEHGIELVDSATLLARIAREQPDRLRTAHRLTVDRSPKSEEEILTTLERAIGAEAAAVVRAVVEPEAQGESVD